MNNDQTYFGADDSVFSYSGTKSNSSPFLIGLGMGAEKQLSNSNFRARAGLEYITIWPTQINGLHSVGDEPQTYTLYNTHYQMQTQQTLLTARVSKALQQDYHLYLMAGLGLSFNRLSQYRTSTVDSGSFNLTPSFANHTQSSFSYSLGAGIEREIEEHIRLGLGYRFSDLGKASFGLGQVMMNTYAAPVPFTLVSSHAYSNQLLVQLSYIA